MSMSDSTDSELVVTFFPQLFLQRRMEILSILRRENVTAVLDIGCGEGALLAALAQPPPWLPAPIKTRAEHDVYPLYPTLIEGLDVADLQFAIQSVKPSEEKRWCPLKVKLFSGGLQDFNPEFVGFESIVASEVLEHLPEEVLSQFAPMIMGVYHPRVLVLTTPNYTFNARFAPPGSPSARDGFPDPTGRTDRVFRHDDHKFEWTTQEFDEWCNIQAAEYGYHVKTYTIGRANEEDPWGRDKELGGASQVAEFIRDEAQSRAIPVLPETTTAHHLVTEYDHPVRPEAGKPKSLSEIGEAVHAKMEYYRETLTWLEGLWFEDEISSSCGGSIEVLVAAVQEHPKLELITHAKEKRSEWQVRLEGSAVGATYAEDEPPDWEPEEPFEVPADWENSVIWEEHEPTELEESSRWGDELN